MNDEILHTESILSHDEFINYLAIKTTFDYYEHLLGVIINNKNFGLDFNELKNRIKNMQHFIKNGEFKDK